MLFRYNYKMLEFKLKHFYMNFLKVDFHELYASISGF